MSIEIDGLPLETRRGRVLICDDSATLRVSIQNVLKGELDCLSVPSAEEALAVAAEFRPDLIVSDLIMEGMSGIELCERVRKEPHLKQVPVILLTSKADDESRATGLEAGADDYLFKPIRPRELLARVRQLLRLRRSVQSLELANESLRSAQEALVRSEKLATVGTLVAGIAHEINNPLAFMSVGAGQMQEYVQDVVNSLQGLQQEGLVETLEGTLADMRDIAREISEGTTRLKRIAGDLKTFARSNGGEAQEVDLAVEIRRAWAMAVLPAQVRPELVIETESMPALIVQVHQLGQVLLNLFVNAVQAISGPGTVWVRCRTGESGLAIEIRDSGPGIPTQHLKRVFDPFFTTKPPGQGTGLGLSVSFGILQGLGGKLDVESPPGEGAKFTINLPCRPPDDQYNALRAGGT